jgi:tRNA (cytidine/uridine-2'-O-)-methyltransferase
MAADPNGRVSTNDSADDNRPGDDSTVAELTGPTVHVVLVAPEIAGNTGNVIRLCANTGAVLHLVEPLGFVLDDSRMKRAGLDYHERTSVRVHTDFDACLRSLGNPTFAAFTARGTARYDEVSTEPGVYVFGCEATGLPEAVLGHPLCAATVTLPMMPDNRSLNLANTVAITVYDRWRRMGFVGAGSGHDPLTVEDLSQR